jgi:glycosyltransferase involved in cell wall biosynthesis
MAQAHLIDLTRLVSRQGRAALTGIDRVELHWLLHLLDRPDPLFALVRTAAGYLLLPREGAALVAAMTREGSSGGHRGQIDLLSRLTRRNDPARGRAETALRPLALARVPRPLLARALRRHLPQGAVWLNLGHANLTGGTFGAIRAAGLTSAVMIHDTIPLDFPHLCRADAPMAFAAKLLEVSAHADRVIHLTRTTRAKTESHLSRLGRVPQGITAPLGVTVAPPDFAALPAGLDLTRPYFVALGTIEPRKNHSLLLDVWDRLAKDGTPPDLYILGGRGWADTSLLARLDARPAGIVELSGLSDGAVSALVAKARALLFPTLAEGYGLPPLEAAALGTRVVCSNLSVLREVLKDYPVYLSPSDSYSWTETIRAEMRAENRTGQVWQGNLPAWEDHFNAVLSQT